jgi:hypothetical protein
MDNLAFCSFPHGQRPVRRARPTRWSIDMAKTDAMVDGYGHDA